MTEENSIPDFNVASIIEASFDGIIISDARGKVLMANSAVERITRTRPSELIGKTVEDLLKYEIIPYATGLEAIRQKKPYTRLQEYKNGKTALVTSNPIFNKDGKPPLQQTSRKPMVLIMG